MKVKLSSFLIILLLVIFCFCTVRLKKNFIDFTKYDRKWAGPPNDLNLKVKDYAYFIVKAEIYSPKRSYSIRKESCFDAAKYGLKEELFTFIYTIEFDNFELNNENCKNYEIKNADGVKVAFFEQKSRKKLEDFFLSNMHLYSCSSLGDINRNNYTECECIYYLYLKGGQITAEKNFYKILCEYTDEELCQKSNICN